MLEVTVSSPKTVGESVTAHVAYQITSTVRAEL